jgi:hypothetical protein
MLGFGAFLAAFFMLWHQNQEISWEQKAEINY